MEYNKCFVPSCNNDSVNSPDKIIVKIRENLREEWCKAANTEFFRVYNYYCCEDHFDPAKDLKNFHTYKKQGRYPVLKPTAKFRNPAKSPVKTSSASTTQKKVSKEPESEQPELQQTFLQDQPLLSIRETKRVSFAETTRPAKKRVAPKAMNDFSKACRCCLLKVGPMKPIFGSSLDAMLTDLMGFQVKRNDGYPQQICTRCIRKLSSAHNFYQTVNKSHKTVEEKCNVVKRANTKESSAHYAIKDIQGNEMFAETTVLVSVSSQTEEKYFQKLMLANVQLSRVEREGSYEIPDTEYVMLSENECEDELPEKKYLRLSPDECETHEELADVNYGYKCPQCLHVSNNEADLKEHMETHLSGAAGSPEEADTPEHLCNVCGQTFKCRTSLYKHLRFHNGNIFECKFCDKQFAEQSTLRVHQLSHSTSEPKPFDCAACDRTFTQKGSLRKHVRAMHSAQRAVHRCKQCDRSFLYKYSMNKHCLRHHSVIRCTLCDAEISGMKALEAHMKTHKQTKALTLEAEYLEFDEL